MPIPNQTLFDPELPLPPERKYGPTLTIQETFHIERQPHEVYEFLSKVRNLIQALPELRVLRLVNGESYFWKLEYDSDFWLEGELHFTQRTHKEIVLWQSPESADTQVSGSLRFHASDDPIVSEDDELPTTRLALTMHWQVPIELQDKLGTAAIEKRIANSFRDAFERIKSRMEEKSSPLR